MRSSAMRRIPLVSLAPIVLLLFKLMCKWRQRAKRGLQKWIVTEYRWPRVEDHVCLDIDLPAAECSDLADPAHAALAGNLEFMQTFGAKIAEGVDGYLASTWVHRNLGLAHHQITLVAWGSPHMELSDGTYSKQKAGAAACEKACVFQSLCKQFRHSFVLILFAGHGVHPVQAGSGEAVLALPALLEFVFGSPGFTSLREPLMLERFGRVVPMLFAKDDWESDVNKMEQQWLCDSGTCMLALNVDAVFELLYEVHVEQDVSIEDILNVIFDSTEQIQRMLSKLEKEDDPQMDAILDMCLATMDQRQQRRVLQRLVNAFSMYEYVD
ncbi:unnamed protein product [Symbiodinium natans]|uniref:Uncharacterized protein n=1 Tax=Symbiodinium natans TaxID=878477 RepID=A0A812MIK1_9DINO|nr:unnamed protein product [Symbiodinium natans]